MTSSALSDTTQKLQSTLATSGHTSARTSSTANSTPNTLTVISRRETLLANVNTAQIKVTNLEKKLNVADAQLDKEQRQLAIYDQRVRRAARRAFLLKLWSYRLQAAIVIGFVGMFGLGMFTQSALNAEAASSNTEIVSER